VTGRHRVDVTVERPLRRLLDTDDVVFAVLDTVRAVGPVTAVATPVLETLPAPPPAPELPGPRIGPEAVAALQGMAGKRWNPSVLRTPAGRELVDAELVGRFGTIPPSTAALLEPWADDAQPVTLEQHDDDGRVSRLQAWSGTVVDGTDEGAVVASVAPERVVALMAGRLGIGPVWTWPFRTGSLRADLVGRSLVRGEGRPALPPEVAEADETLARFWAAPWTVSHLRRPGRARPVTFVRAEGVGFARVGRTEAGATAFRAESPANVHRSIVRALTAEAG
jgi:hypothetical protein